MSRKTETKLFAQSVDERYGRPPSGMAKQLIAIRLGSWPPLTRMAAKQQKPYQTLIHELFEKAACHAA